MVTILQDAQDYTDRLKARLTPGWNVITESRSDRRIALEVSARDIVLKIVFTMNEPNQAYLDAEVEVKVKNEEYWHRFSEYEPQDFPGMFDDIDSVMAAMSSRDFRIKKLKTFLWFEKSYLCVYTKNTELCLMKVK